MLKIRSTEKNGIGRELGLKRGDELLCFDGHPAVDILDYLYYDAKNEFSITVRQTNGDVSTCEIEKDDDERLGINFESDNLAIRTCRNNCVFCFVDQMPRGMRDTLYVKDDDYRQSFLCGNFVTLTNAEEEDIERIIRLNLSPLYVSVHTMNGELRKKMLRNRFAGRIADYVKRLAEGGITMHTQIVLARGYNDGKELDYSARELFKFYPRVQTMAVVPVGMTKFRENLTHIDDIDKEYAKEVIDQARRLNKEFGVNFVQLGDEFYFRAGEAVEEYEFYGAFPQIENGIGTTAKFDRELKISLEEREYHRSFLLICGTSAAEYIRGAGKLVEKYVKGIKTETLAVKNKFFGESVNCTGLLTGGDIAAAVKDYGGDYDCLVMPRHVLKENTDLFLDGMTVGRLKDIVGKEVRITDGTGEGFFRSLSED